MTDANMLTLAIETYQRLLPELKHRIGINSHPDPVESVQIDLPSLSNLIEMVQPAPPKSCLVGMCEDGIPFMLDLTGSETGSILVTGDSGCGKTHQLQVMAESAMRMNLPHEVQICVLTGNPDEWEGYLRSHDDSRYIIGIYAWYEQGANDLINHLVALGESRSSGRHPGATVLFLIDDLTGVFEADFEIQNGLHWLLEYGPACGIRPIASIKAEHCPTNSFWVDAFRTFLVGRIESDSLAVSLGLEEGYSPKHLSNLEFSAFTGQEWTKFRLPTSE